MLCFVLRGDENKRERLPVAAIVTEYRRNSHADVIIGKILEGYDQEGGRRSGFVQCNESAGLSRGGSRR